MQINHKSNSRENLSLFFNAHVRKYAINTPFWRHIDAILASSPACLPFSDICWLRKPTFCWRFVLIYGKAGGQNCRGNLPEWRIDRVGWRRWDARGDMREDINFKDADRELNFCLISILWFCWEEYDVMKFIYHIAFNLTFIDFLVTQFIILINYSFEMNKKGVCEF